MGTKTYLDIVNIVLQDANEVPLTEGSFPNSRGLQTFVKEAVNRALMDIVNASREWDWLKSGVVRSPTSVTTADGTQWYDFKTLGAQDLPFTEVDFDTFFLTEGTVQYKRLNRISYDQWNDLYREVDEQLDAKGTPDFVIEVGEDNTFGLSPVPDKAYTIEFISWNSATFLTNALDTIPFPDQYYNTLIARTRYYLWSFKENDTQAQRAAAEYRENLGRMLERQATPQSTRLRLV